MTPDLERAVDAMQPGDGDLDALCAAIRALLDPSPAVVEVMTRRLHEVNQSLGLWDEPLTRSRCREMALAAWRAGIDAILESKP